MSARLSDFSLKDTFYDTELTLYVRLFKSNRIPTEAMLYITHKKIVVFQQELTRRECGFWQNILQAHDFLRQSPDKHYASFIEWADAMAKASRFSLQRPKADTPLDAAN